MSYTPPAGNAVELTWQGQAVYTPPAGNAVELTWLYVPPVAQPAWNRRLAAGAGWGRPARRQGTAHLAWGQPARLGQHGGSAWADGEARQRDPRFPWAAPDPAGRPVGTPWAAPAPRGDQRALPWGTPADRRAAAAIDWTPADPRRLDVLSPWGQVAARLHRLALGWSQTLARVMGRRLPWNRPAPTDEEHATPWKVPRIAHPFFLPPVPVVPSEPNPAAGAGYRPFLFFDFYRTDPADPHRPHQDASGLVHLDFRHRPVRMIRVQHTATLQRWPSLEAIPCSGARIGLNRGDTAWQASLQIPDPAAAAAIAPTLTGNQEVLLTLNGYSWRLVVEALDETRQFGSTGTTVQARTLSAYLGAPYAEARTHTETAPRAAQQLAEQELDGLGFTLDWQLPDALAGWIVPEGAWSYTGKTRIDAIATLAAAAGGIVVPGRTGKTLAVEYQHKTPSWGWAAAVPDRILNDSLLHRRTSRFEPAPQHNKVYVFGGPAGGVGAGITREGTAGDKPAPTVIDPLVTHASAAQERGRQILSQTGNRLHLGIDLPLTPANQNPGLIEPGLLLLLPEGGIGHVTGVSIAADWKDGLAIRQSVSIERAQ